MLDKLKEYKDLIGLVVFFLGGFLWIQGQFPTKTDLKAQLDILGCKLNNYMTLTQDQRAWQDLVSDTQNLNTNISSASSADLSPSYREQIVAQWKSQLADDGAQMKKVKDEMTAIDRKLAMQVCESQ